MIGQHFNNKIGNVIGQAKRRMFDRLKAGESYQIVLKEFLEEIRSALENLKP